MPRGGWGRMDAMPVSTPSSAPARLADLLTPLAASGEGVPFARAVVWAHGDAVQVGDGGWTVLLHGTDRLARLSALWQAAVAGRPDPTAPARAWISSTFAEDSPEPAVLRVPARLLRADADGVREVAQHVDADALAAAVVADPDARLIPGGDVPLPADAAALAWDDSGYADGVRRVLALMQEAGAVEPLEKVVISRTLTLPAGDAELWAGLEALREGYPQTWVFAVGGLMGATPEILATRHAGTVTSRVLAGSVPRGATEEEDAALRARLVGDARLGHEHRWAARSVVDALAPVVELEDADPAPTLLTLPNVHHLATAVRRAGRPDLPSRTNHAAASAGP